MNSTPPVALVVWEDAHSPDLHETWVPAEQPTWKALMAHSVGFLLYDGPEGVTLTDTVIPDFTGQRQNIPRGMIREVVLLNPPRRKKPRADKTDRK